MMEQRYKKTKLPYTEERIGYKTALLAKEKGFLINYCDAMYGKEGKLTEMGCDSDFVRNFDEWALAPSQSFVQKWLREVKSINVSIMCVPSDKERTRGHFYESTIHQKGEEDSHSSIFSTYELALEEAIETALLRLL